MSNKNQEQKSSELGRTILATIAGLLLILSAWYYVEFYGKEMSETLNQNNYVETEDPQIIIDPVIDEEPPSDTEEEGAFVDDITSLVSCLQEKEVVIYGNKTCPACANLASNFGGFDAIEDIYVECNENRDRCTKEKETRFVPEIQVGGNIYEGGRNPSEIALAVGCDF